MIDKDEFDKLSRAEKRVAILNDILERIRDHRILLLYGNRFGNRFLDAMSVETDLKEAVNKTRCEVCAKGALIVSWIGNFNCYNDLSLFDSPRSKLPKELEEIFGQLILDAMELAFERNVFGWMLNVFKRSASDHLPFDYSFVWDRQPSDFSIRLLGEYKNFDSLLRHMIENNGTIKVGDETLE